MKYHMTFLDPRGGGEVRQVRDGGGLRLWRRRHVLKIHKKIRMKIHNKIHEEKKYVISLRSWCICDQIVKINVLLKDCTAIFLPLFFIFKNRSFSEKILL